MADGSVSLSFTRNCFQLNTLSWLDIGHYKIKPRVIYHLINGKTNRGPRFTNDTLESIRIEKNISPIKNKI